MQPAVGRSTTARLASHHGHPFRRRLRVGSGPATLPSRFHRAYSFSARIRLCDEEHTGWAFAVTSVRNVKAIYLALAVVGAIVPIALGVVFLTEHGLDGGEAGRQLFGSTASTLALADLSISSLVFWVWLAREAPRVGIRLWWPFVAANLLVGLSFALPLFLYVRSTRLAGAKRPDGVAAVGAQ